MKNAIVAIYKMIFHILQLGIIRFKLKIICLFQWNLQYLYKQKLLMLDFYEDYDLCFQETMRKNIFR